jgi:hypothetical protein
MALVNPNIAMGYRGVELPNQLAQYGQIAAIQSARNQNEASQMQLESLRRDRDVLGRIQAAIVAKGGPPDLAAAADEMIKSGKPEYMTQGAAIRQKLAGQAAFAAYESEFGPKTQNALSPAFGMPAGDQAPGDYTSTQTMGRVPGVVTTPVPESPPMNAMAPAPAAPVAPVNAMAGQPDIAGLEARYRRVANIDTPGAKAEAALLLKQIDRASTAAPADIKTMQALGYPITQAGFAAFRDAQRPDRLLTPAEEAQKVRIGQATRPPGTTVNMVSERAEQGARGKMLVDQYADISKAAGLAARTLPAIESNLSALNKGFDTGFGKETVAAGASVLAALGVKDAEKFATDSQKFQSNAISAVLQKQLEQKGPQTESDAKRIEQIGAQLGKTKNANEFILATAKEQLKRDVEQRNYYDRWYKTNKTYDGAEDAWFNGEGGRSLFDRPGLKKYSVSATDTAAQIPTSATPPRAAPTPPRAAPTAPNIDALLNKYK